MSTHGKRLFSSNNDITFNDYLSNKKGTEIIKQIKSNDGLLNMRFLSYNDFNMLIKAYSKNSNILQTNIQSNVSINDKTKDLIYYEKIVSHIKICHYCKYNNQTISNLLLCNEIKNIIYAYEHNFKNTTSNIFQNKMNLNRWCKTCDHSFPLFHEKYENENDYEYDYEYDYENKYDYEDKNENENKDKDKYDISSDYYFKRDIKNDTIDKKLESQNECNCPHIDIKKKSSGRRPIFCSNCSKFIDICNCSKRWSRIEAINRVNHKNDDTDDKSSLSYVNKKSLFIRK